MEEIEFRVLGPVEVARAGEPLDLGARKQRWLLAALLVASPEVLSVDALLDRVWGERPPKSAPHALQVYVSNLRKLLESDRGGNDEPRLLVTREPGYALVVSGEQHDARRFETLVRRAEASSDPDEASELLEAALDLWRGPALADVADADWAVHEAARLDGLRLTALEGRFDAELERGRHAAVVEEISAVARQHLLRERFWEQLVLALYRCGRQADALGAHREISRHLAEELGLQPGPDLARLEGAVLRHDPALAWSPPGSGRGTSVAPAREAPDDDPAPTLPTARPDDRDQTGQTNGDKGQIPGDEHRIVTALFADLVGSTALGESLSPDEYKLVVDGAVRRMVSSCEHFGGEVVNIAGDGILALFGAPVAHEDDPERAVLAGLRLRAEVEAYGQEVTAGWGVEPLQARVGVSTGPVIAGLADSGEHVRYSALGDTVNTASRLETAAPPGAVLVDGSTRARLGPSFTWSEPYSLSLKGKAEPVEACQATGGRPGGGRTRGLEDRPTRLHARDAELGEARAAVEEVVAGRGSVLVVAGAPGLGKSRLLRELRASFEDEGDPQRPLLWLQGACLSYGESQLLWPLREIVAGWMGVPLDQPGLRLRVALRSSVEELFGEDADGAAPTYTALAAVLGIEEEEADWPRARPVAPTSLHEGVCGAFEVIGRDRPVVVAVDDLHWADRETLRLVESLAQATERSAVLLVLASRLEPDNDSWALLEQIRREMPHRSRHLELGGLDRSVAADLLEELTGSRVLPPDRRDELLLLAEGNPFYLEELVRTLIADGVLVRGDEGFRYRGGDVRLPESVEQVVVSRLDRVDLEVRSVLTAASVLGRQFSRSLLETLVELPGGTSRLDDALIELQRSALVREVRRWPEPQFEFEHALIREAAYDILPGPTRQELHRRTAEILSQGSGDEASVGEIGHHWEHAGDDERALDAYRRAGESAERRGTLTAATDLYAAALAAAGRLGSERVEAGRVAQLLVARWSAAVHAGEVAGAAEGLAEAVAQAETAGDTATEVRALETLGFSNIRIVDRGRRELFQEAVTAARRGDDPSMIARSLGRLAIDEANDLALREARANALEAMEVTRDSGPEARVWALDARKLVALYLGEFDVLGAVLEELWPLLEDPRLTWVRRFAVLEAAVLDLAVGATHEAERKVLDAVELSRRVNESTDQEVFLAVLCSVRRAGGDYGAALDAGRRAFEQARERAAWWVPWAAAEYGSLLLDLGDHARATECLRRGVGFEPAMRSHEVRCSGLLALAGQKAGDEDSERIGVEAAQRLLNGATLPEGCTYLYGADGMLALAEARLARGEDDAERDAVEVADAAEEAGWLEPAARGRHVLGLAALRRADVDVAVEQLERAVELADGVLPGIAWRAHAALGQATGDSQARGRAGQILDELAGTVEDPERDVLLGSLGA